MSDISKPIDPSSLTSTQNEQWLTLITNAVPALIAYLTPDYTYRFANEEYARWFEVQTGKYLIGKTIEEAFGPKVFEKISALFARAFAGERVEFEQEMPFPNGTRYIRAVYTPDIDPTTGKVRGAVSLIHDITAQKLSEIALKNAKQSAEDNIHELQREREVRERFVSALTHDLRTPLTAAKLTAQVLLKKVGDQENFANMSSRIISNLDRTDRMIRDLLDANLIKGGGHLPLYIESCRLDLLVQQVVDELTEIHGYRFIIKNECGIVEGQWDNSTLQRVLENLGGNAIKYGSQDTIITFEIKTGENWAEFSVQNFGTVLSSEDQRILFHPYQRTNDALKGGEKGWGLGLTLVKGIAEAHNGSARVESSVENGTVFTVRIPLKHEENV